MSSLIATCRCKSMPDKAKTAYTLLFPNTPLPPLLIGRALITHKANEFSGQLRDRLKALAKTNRKFAYYIEYENDDTITKLINLETGAKVQ